MERAAPYFSVTTAIALLSRKTTGEWIYCCKGFSDKSLVSVGKQFPNLLRKQSVTRKAIPHIKVSLWVSAQFL